MTWAVTIAVLLASGCGSEDPVSESAGSTDAATTTTTGAVTVTTVNETTAPDASDPDETSTTAPDASDPDETSTTAPATEPPAEPAPSLSVSPNATPDLVASTQPPSTPTQPSSPGDFDLDPDSRLVRGAVDDLAGRLDVDAAEVTVVSARAVTWGDSSLGCPTPGMKYLPSITDGSLVILDVDGTQYEYHGGSPLELCEQPEPPVGD